MTILLWMLGISIIINIVIRYMNRDGPQAGDDYIGELIQIISTGITAVLAIITLFVWL